jgi:hypothetical protein
VVVFGGEGSHEGTLIYDPWHNEWRWPEPAVEPAPRSGGNMAYDAARKLHVLFGSQFTDDPHTWTYDVATNRWRDMKPPAMPPTDKNDAVLTYDPINEVVLAIVKVTSGEGDAERHDVQTWAYNAGGNEWTRMHPASEPESGGNRRRNLVFAPELNLAILENCTGRPREQQIWTYRYADSKTEYKPSRAETRESPPIVDEVVVSVLAKNRIELSWKSPASARLAGYHVERAVVEVWSEDQLPRLKGKTPPLGSPSVGAIRRIGRFQRLTDKPLEVVEFTDRTIDLSSPQVIEGEPIYDSRMYDEHLDRSGRHYGLGVFAYRVRAVDDAGRVSGPSPASLTLPSSPEHLFSREDGETCRLRWAANPEKGVTGYRIYRMDGRWNKDPMSRLTPQPISETVFADRAAGRRTRRYYVVAVDALGQEGLLSSPVWHRREWRAYYEPFVGEWHQ